MNIRLTSLFVSLFLSVPVWAGGHKILPAKGDLPRLQWRSLGQIGFLLCIA